MYFEDGLVRRKDWRTKVNLYLIMKYLEFTIRLGFVDIDLLSGSLMVLEHSINV